MGVFIIQLIAIIIGVVAFFLLLLEVVDVGVPLIGDPDNFWTGGYRSGTRFRMPVTIKSLILIGLIVAAAAVINLTQFDICSFLRFWFTETQGLLPPSCR
jgi:hypothetical protein